jgi:DNA-binding IclR family transcriptional regulator
VYSALLTPHKTAHYDETNVIGSEMRGTAMLDGRMHGADGLLPGPSVPTEEMGNQRVAAHVRSASRALEIVEFIVGCGEPQRSLDVANGLSIPPSSTNEILKTLVEAGYLAFSRKTRRYAPSIRLAALGRRASRACFGGDGLLDVLFDLRDATGETAGLFCQNGARMQFMASVAGRDNNPLRWSQGSFVEIPYSASGRALLMTKSDAEIIEILRGSVRARPKNVQFSIIEDILGQVRIARGRGYAVSAPSAKCNPPSLRGVAVCVPISRRDFPLVIGIGSREAGREHQVAALLRRSLDRHLN